MKLPARAQRVDEPAPGALSIELYAAGEKAYLLVSPALAPALELRDSRPRGEGASPFVSQLRRHLKGARLVGVRVGPHGLALDFEGRAPLSLVGERREGLALFRDGRVIVGSRAVPAPGPELEPLPSLDALRAVPGGSLVDRSREAEIEARRAEVRRALARARARLERKRRAVEGDLARAGEAGALRAEAEALLIHLGKLERGLSEVTLELPDGGRRTVRLDPRRTPNEEVELRFKRARRLERGAVIAAERLAVVTRDLEVLLRQLASVGEADEARLAALAEAFSPRVPGSQAARRKGPPPRLPYRQFRSKDGLEILVGRSAADNDTLTLRIARPGDLFVHARGVTGSHVIVRNDRTDVPVETLLDAATLAVHFSAAAKEPCAEVQYAERRYVRKGRGFAAGAVRVDRERVLLLHMQEERLRRLLEERERPIER